jgi:hypothetical protein
VGKGMKHLNKICALVIPFVTASMAITGCKKHTNKVQSYQFVSGFHTLVLNSSFDVSLVEADSFALMIQGSEKSTKNVQFEVNDSTLTLKNNTPNKWLHPKTNKVFVTIYCPKLRLVRANETCFVHTLTPITTQEFGLIVSSKLNGADIEVNNEVCYIWNQRPCGGNYVFRGKSNWCKFVIARSGLCRK